MVGQVSYAGRVCFFLTDQQRPVPALRATINVFFLSSPSVSSPREVSFGPRFGEDRKEKRKKTKELSLQTERTLRRRRRRLLSVNDFGPKLKDRKEASVGH